MAETICAVSTPHGRGGIGIVRVSGDLVQEMAQAIVGQVPQPRLATFTKFMDEHGDSIDSGIALFFPKPQSFTGEDVLELQGHGNPILHEQLIERLCELGARLAHPGEFTERAYLNDRMDLAQAEAVMDLINSSSSQASQAAMRSLQGGFSDRVLQLDKQVLELRVFMESAIDFVEEEIDFLSDGEQNERMSQVIHELGVLIENCEHGKQLQFGYNLVIAGAPNVGKSSLFNALLNENRAIVTEIAGTTRDTLDAIISLDGLPISLVDTAGMHDTADPVEVAGIQRAKSALALSDLTLWITDDRESHNRTPQDQEVLSVRNKCDLSGGEIGCRADGSVGISAKTGAGLPALRSAIQEYCGFHPRDDAFAGRPRHLKALNNARQHLQIAEEALRNKQGELVAENLRLAHQSFGEVVGTTTSDDLLGEIFSKFCIGK